MIPAESSVYRVFARVDVLHPLAQVGTVRAPNIELARAYSRATYSEERWLEMIAVPENSVVQVIDGEVRE